MGTPLNIEAGISRELTIGSSASRKRKSVVINAATEDDAINTALADTTLFPVNLTTTLFNGSVTPFVRDRAYAREINDSNAAPSTWEVTVEYVPQGTTVWQFATGDSSKCFEIGIQQVQTFVSEEVGKFAASGTAPSFSGLINVSMDGVTGQVNGVSVDVPTFSWSEVHYMADADVTTGYINGVYGVSSNPINDDTFRGFAAGEVKFMGLQGAQRGKDGDWEMCFRFQASPNLADVEIGNIPHIYKKGWEVLWFLFEDVLQTAGSVTVLVKQAKYAYVNKVYGESDYSALGI